MKNIFLLIFLFLSAAVSSAQSLQKDKIAATGVYLSVDQFTVDKVVELNSHKRYIRQIDNFLVSNGFCYLLDLKSKSVFVFDETGKCVDESEADNAASPIPSDVLEKLLNPAATTEKPPHLFGFFPYEKWYRTENQLVFLVTQASVDIIDAYKKAMSYADWLNDFNASNEQIQQLIKGKKHTPALVYVTLKD